MGTDIKLPDHIFKFYPLVCIDICSNLHRTLRDTVSRSTTTIQENYIKPTLKTKLRIRPTQLRIVKPSKEHSRGSTEFPNQKLGVDRGSKVMIRHTNKQSTLI